MKSLVMKTLLLASAAVAVGAIAPSASAGTLRYTFTGFCDGIKLTKAGVTYGGERTGCVSDPAGGVAMRVRGNPTVYIDYATADNGTGTFTYFLDIPGLQWFLYDTQGGVFTEINSGTLTAGPPPAEVGLKSSSSSKAKHPLSGPF